MSPRLTAEILAMNLTTRHCPGQLRIIYWRLVRLLEGADAQGHNHPTADRGTTGRCAMNPAVANLTLFLVCLIELRSSWPKGKSWQHWLTAFLVTVITVRFL